MSNNSTFAICGETTGIYLVPHNHLTTHLQVYLSYLMVLQWFERTLGIFGSVLYKPDYLITTMPLYY